MLNQPWPRKLRRGQLAGMTFRKWPNVLLLLTLSLAALYICVVVLALFAVTIAAAITVTGGW
ncbi:hypothetical protein DESA109040_14980 [Deinococcus saxicola]|uniref:hypothetical protein n=1 Tax=Deinococcus saxicola TaxID=249406 RepID=UPI0039EE0BA5